MKLNNKISPIIDPEDAGNVENETLISTTTKRRYLEENYIIYETSCKRLGSLKKIHTMKSEKRER